MTDLKRQRIMSDNQYDELYPFNGDTSRIDISLWLILARYITATKSRNGIDWRKSPETHEVLWAHDLIRLKEIRNFLFHVSAPELVGEKFNEIRSELVRVLRRLGTSDQVINDHMSRDLDPQQTKLSVLQIREQYMEDQNVLLREAAEHKKHTRILIVVLSLLAAFVLISISVPVAKYFDRKVPCSASIQRMTTSKPDNYMSTLGLFFMLTGENN